jgi:hypothetical protein
MILFYLAHWFLMIFAIEALAASIVPAPGSSSRFLPTVSRPYVAPQWTVERSAAARYSLQVLSPVLSPSIKY